MTKTILVTGATDGIGKHLATKLASEGHEVILHGRNPEKLRVAHSDIRLKTGNDKVRTYLADFSKTADVYRFAGEIARDFDKLDVLFNNAGLFAGADRRATAEDVELTFMLSVQVPYILTTELLPLLKKAEQGRVIHTSSFMHRFANVKVLDFGLKEKYNPTLAYNNAKLYTIWLGKYQAEQLRQAGSRVTVNSYHPGLISTNLGNDSADEKTKKSLFAKVMKKLSKNLDEGIETGYYLTLSEEVAGLSGHYFDDKRMKRVSYKEINAVKLQALIDYCNGRIKVYLDKQ